MGSAGLWGWLQGPSRCYLCWGRSTRSALVCDTCRADLPGPRPACARCGRRLLSPAPSCRACRGRRLPWDRICCPLDYRFPVDRLVQAFKFHGDHVAGRLLSQCLLEAVRAGTGPLPEALVPVPLHPRRQRRRGFNQSAEIAADLARGLGLPLLTDRLKRWRHDPPQSGLGARQRRANVAGAYLWQPGPVPTSVALVDDVLTTGSTVRAAARVLRSAGVRRVEVWVVARASGVPAD